LKNNSLKGQKLLTIAKIGQVKPYLIKLAEDNNEVFAYLFVPD
jgi:hypothetical protein